MKNTIEIWKDIIGYESLYQVSNIGNVRSLDRFIYRCKNGKSDLSSFYKKKGKNVALTDNGNGYKLCSLSNKGRKNHYIHRLVAIHFLENKNNYLEVNHKNGNKSDNKSENLEWVTRNQNMKHASINGYLPKGGDKFNSIKVIDVHTLQVFDCIRECADFYEVKKDLLIDALNSGAKHRNFIYSRLMKLDKWIEENPLEAIKMGLSFKRI